MGLKKLYGYAHQKNLNVLRSFLHSDLVYSLDTRGSSSGVCSHTVYLVKGNLKMVIMHVLAV